MSEKVLVLKVEGMTCQGCVNNVTNALKAVRGAGEVRVSLEGKKASIHFDPDKANDGMFREAIIKAGYKVG